MGLLLSILWRNTHEEWLNIVQKDYPGIISEEEEWYLLQSPNLVPCHLLEIQTTPLQGHPALTSPLEPILVVTMPEVAKIFNCVIDKMRYVTDSEVLNLLHAVNANIILENMMISSDKPENRWNIHRVTFDT